MSAASPASGPREPQLSRRLSFEAIAGALSAAIAVGLAFHLARELVSTPEMTATDFTVFRTGWSLIVDGRARELYDPAAQTAVQTALLAKVGSAGFQSGTMAFLHPPHAALAGCALELVARGLGTAPAFWLWTACSLAFLAHLVRLVRGELGLDRRATALVAVSLAAFYPVLETLQQGQVSALLGVAALACVVAARQGRSLAAALWLLALSIKPQTLPALVVVLAVRRERRVLGLAALLGAAAVVVTALVLGPRVWWDYLTGLRALERYFGAGTPDHMPTVRGFLTRLVGVGRHRAAVDALTIAAWLGAIAAAGAAALRTRASDGRAAFAAALALERAREPAPLPAGRAPLDLAAHARARGLTRRRSGRLEHALARRPRVAALVRARPRARHPRHARAAAARRPHAGPARPLRGVGRARRVAAASARGRGVTGDVTRYAALSRRGALGVVVLLVALAAWLVHGALASGHAAPVVAGGPPPQPDVALCRAVVERVRAGENYYDADAAELRRRSFAMGSPFNWRQPTYAWVLAALPSPYLGNALLALVGALIVRSTWRRARASSLGARAGVAAALTAVAMAGALVGAYVYMQDLWAGFFVALSVSLFADDRRWAGVAAAFVALAFREFALLPCLIGLALALRERRGREVAAWLGGLAAYAAFMAWHAAEIARRVRPDDLRRAGWLAWGGAAFVVETARWSPLLVALPSLVVAVALPFVLLGLAGRRDAGAARAALIVFGYLATFVAIGHPFNDYWGGLYAPLLPLGFVAAPASVRELARALRARPLRAG